MSERLRLLLPVAIAIVFVSIALEVLRVELRTVSWHALSADVVRMPRDQLAVAFVLTAANYLVLTGYDRLAFAYLGKALPYSRIALVSFLAYAISNNVGFPVLSGASVRYRFYTRWGFTAEDLSRIVFADAVTFWLGLLGLGGLSLAVAPIPALPNVPSSALLAPVGWLLMLMPMGYIVATCVWPKPLRVRGFRLPLPSTRIATLQLAISIVEWTLAGAVLYVLLPASQLSFLEFLGIFVAAVLLGIASHVPGGVGVFEGLMVLLLKPHLSAGELIPALVVYRGVYYLLPLSVALVGLVVDEARQRRDQAVWVGARLGQLTERLTPRILAVVTFLAGVVLLFSGATPSAEGRLALIHRVLPLGIIEASHFLGSVAGAALLVLSHGLARRLDGAYYLAAAVMIVGVAASVFKGFDYEEAALLVVVLVVLWRARPAFDRRAAFLEARFSAAWVTALICALGASVWLGLFAFEHVDYSRELWWQFALEGEASRYLRASVGAAVVLFTFGFARLVGPAPPESLVPSDADLRDAEKAIAAQTSTFPNLVLLRDKAMLFNAERTAFVMYGVQGRTWVALGDPVGPDDQLPHLIRLFLERCDDFGGVPVFYEISSTHLHRYADVGLTFVKLGEEATVDLTTFTLEDAHGAKHRQAIRRLEKEGSVFRVVDSAGTPAIMNALRAVSDDWLEQKATAEKGFSVGFFDERYLSRCPVAIIEHEGAIQAFANILEGPQHVELSIDLMRYHHGAPKGVMEALLVHLMQWGKARGYRRFALGMAPLSGFEQSPVASPWTRIGGLLYEHGEAVYNFQGLRAFKEKFDPIWESHYLAYSGGLRLPRVLADVAALIAGGYRRILFK